MKRNGLYYYRARYYDPAVGRFISEDPIGFADGENFYLYAGNDPVGITDPFGLSDIVITVTRTATTSISTSGTLTLSVDGEPQFGSDSLEPAPTGLFPSIPTGTYPAELYASPHFGGMRVLLLANVPGRTGIEIHPGNTPQDTKGCILPGTSIGPNRVANSRSAFNRIIQIVNQTIRSDIARRQRTNITVAVQ